MSDLLKLIHGLRDAGLDDTSILKAVEVMERSRTDKLEDRKRKDRDRQRRKRERDKTDGEPVSNGHATNGTSREQSTSHVMSRDNDDIEDVSRDVTLPVCDPPLVGPPSFPKPLSPPPISPPSSSAADAREARKAQADRVKDWLDSEECQGVRHTSPGLWLSVPRLLQRAEQAGWDFDDDVMPVIQARTAKPRSSPLANLQLLEDDIANQHTQRTAPIPEGRHETATTPRTHSPHSRQSAGSLGGGGDLGDAIARRQARREAERARDERERIGGNSARLGVDCSDGGSGADIIDLPRIADGRYA